MLRDETGLAWGWHKERKRWERRHPVDFRECVLAGEMSAKAPDGSTPPGFDEKGEAPRKAELEARFASASKPQLRDACTANDVAWQGADTKEALIAKLVANGVTELPMIEGEEVPAGDADR